MDLLSPKRTLIGLFDPFRLTKLIVSTIFDHLVQHAFRQCCCGGSLRSFHWFSGSPVVGGSMWDLDLYVGEFAPSCWGQHLTQRRICRLAQAIVCVARALPESDRGTQVFSVGSRTEP